MVVTGGGRGLGRAYASYLGEQGACVVVNDLDDGISESPAEFVAAAIRAAGGTAVADSHDISTWEGAEALIVSCLNAFGRIDALINNAGILRDRAIVNMTREDWDAVMSVHLRGTFAPSHFAAVHWRQLAKSRAEVNASIVNTTSGSGLYANPYQSNYAAAKAGVAAFTLVAAKELGRYGIRVNAVAPAARTRLTESVLSEEDLAPLDPAHVAPLVAWLASPGCPVTGRVFNVGGGHLSLAEGWHRQPGRDGLEGWTLHDVGPIVEQLMVESASDIDELGYKRPPSP